MRSRFLMTGVTGLLIAGLLLNGCSPEEVAPEEAETTARTQAPETEEPAEAEPSAEKGKNQLPPGDESEDKLAVVTLPEPTSAPPHPETPFVTTEEAVLFEDDFEDGVADGWALDTGWNLSTDENTFVLTGSSHSFARPNVTGWSDYTITSRIKLVRGDLHFNLRENGVEDGLIRYFLHFHPGGVNLNKQLGSDFFDLSQANLPLKYNQWYAVEAVVKNNNIKVYLDGTLLINYTDEDIPILSGISSFETLDNSVTCFDDISVTGTRAVQHNQWVKTGGPCGGLGYDVRIDPLDENVMFVTDNPSGVNKSYDGGDSWVQRNTGITARTGTSGDGIPIFSLTIDPNNPDIVWAGTQTMRGIYKSTDGGETWSKKDNGVEEWGEITFRGFGIRPGNSNIVFAGAEISTGILGKEFDKAKGKIYKTEDGGENWRCVWEGGSLARFTLFDPTNPDIMYASTGIFDREAYNDTGIGVLKSTDGGESWQQINNGLDNLFVGFLEMHPEDQQTLFAAAGNNVNRDNAGIYRTTNGGESWTKVMSDGKCSMTVVTISPSNPDVVYAGGECAFFRSDDGGDSWQEFRRKEGNFGPPGVRAGFPISAVVDPDDSMTVFVNNYSGGVFKSVDGAETWIDCSAGYTGADLHDVELVPGYSNAVYTIGRSGPFRSFNNGQEWAGLAFSPAACAEWNTVAINPQNPQEILISGEFEGSIFRSTNGGNTWEMVFRHPLAGHGEPQESRHGFKAITYAPSDPNIVYAGMRKGRRSIDGDFPPRPSFGIYRSVNGGKTWEEKNNGLEMSDININDMVVHPQNPDIAYAATWRDGIYKTTDGGESWTVVNNGLLSLDVRSLVIDPENPDVIYAGLAEGVGIFKTTNGGELWEPINVGIQVMCPSFLQRVGQVQPGVSLEKPKRLISGEYYSIPWTNISSIVIDPVNPQTLYAADLRLGVYMSTDGGATWIPINEGLSTKAVSALTLSTDGWVLYAATKGEGVFRLELW